jgi:hypothetical protein
VASIVYLACAGTAALCAALLLRAYRATGTRLLLWSGLCFLFLAANNALLTVDFVLVPQIDLFALRNATALAGMSLLLYGLVWDSE